MNRSPVIFHESDTESGLLIATATLNDESSLNALSTDMIDLLYPRLQSWESNPDIACILLRGTGEKAFCAGGNIRKLYESMLRTDFGENSYAERFFTSEYRLDYLIHQYRKPIICYGNGIVMGGGIGLMTGASHRIVTETSMLAMPEISIGLYPDVGSSWFLSRMPEGLGNFIGMTGVRLNAADAVFTGLADYYLPSDQYADFYHHLHKLNWQTNTAENHQLLTMYIKESNTRHSDGYPSSLLEAHLPAIKKIMALDQPDNILKQLQNSENQWLNKCAKTLQYGCPVSAWLVREQILRARGIPLEDIFKMELTMSIHCTRYRDFSEGIRALLIDKDNRPQWEDDSLATVSDEKVQSFFAPIWPAENHPLADLGVIQSINHEKRVTD